MKQTQLPEPSRQASEITWGNITTENRFDIDGTLPGNQAISLTDVDLFQGHMKTRRSIVKNDVHARLSGANVLSEFIWIPDEARDKEYLIYQTANGFEYRDVNNASEDWRIVQDYNFYTATGLGNWFTTGTASYAAAAGKLMVFQSGGNSVFEYISAGGGSLVRRAVGMGRPTITNVTNVIAPPTAGRQDVGEYQYAVEFCYRKNIGTANEADFLTSTPQRRYLTFNGAYVRHNYTNAGNSVEITASTFDSEADKLWTHIKLYRSKKLNQSTTTEIVDGSPDELYACQIVDRATHIANGYILTDLLNDDELPALDADAETVLFTPDNPDMDQEPLPDGNLGAWHKNRIWVSDVTSKLNGNTSLFYTSATSFKYSEQWYPTQTYDCSVGDGQSITDIVSLEEDLIVFKQSQTGRVPGGSPDNTYDKLDKVIGVPQKAFYVPKVGIVALTNNLDDVMIFGYGLQWTSEYRGVPFSKPVRGVFKSNNPGIPGAPGYELTGVAYFEGKILLSVGNYVYAFHVDEGLGWSKYELGFISTGQQWRGLIANTLKNKIFLTYEGSDSTFTTGERDVADFGGTWPSPEIVTAGIQADGGRALIEQRYVSLMAKLSNPVTMSVAYSVREYEQKLDEPFALNPSEANPTGLRAMAEYQYYAKAAYPERTRIYADRLFYTFKTTGYMEFKDLKFYVYTYVGVRPPGATTKASVENDSGILADLSTDLLHWQTAPDMSKDYTDPYNTSKPFQEISFILMRPE